MTKSKKKTTNSKSIFQNEKASRTGTRNNTHMFWFSRTCTCNVGHNTIPGSIKVVTNCVVRLHANAFVGGKLGHNTANLVCSKTPRRGASANSGFLWNRTFCTYIWFVEWIKINKYIYILYYLYLYLILICIYINLYKIMFC